MPDQLSLNSFDTKTTLEGGSGEVYFSLGKLAEHLNIDITRLPFTIRIMLESLLRNEDGKAIGEADIRKLGAYDPGKVEPVELPFKPARVILQDFTGVPAVVDLAALRSAMAEMGGDPDRINPQIPVDLVIDHSVQVDYFGMKEALEKNTRTEFERNLERYTFLRWGQQAFENFGVVPPGNGIIHQVNLEYLATAVQKQDLGGETMLFPDTLVGTDSHTTMINGLGVVGWGVGGIEAEAVMLGQPVYLKTPEVVGFKLTGRLPVGSTATDLVLRVTQMLREFGVVEKFVEFFGDGLDNLSLADRATIANMAPEYGATVGFFPIDGESLHYMKITGRDDVLISRVERYCRTNHLFRDGSETPDFAATLELDMSSVLSCLAGPKRPQDRIELTDMKKSWQSGLEKPVAEGGFELDREELTSAVEFEFEGIENTLTHGSVVIAAITSCTNTSNPAVMLTAGLLAKKAVEAGLTSAPYVKTSLAPGSRVVTEYLDKTGLTPFLEQLGFHTVGYGCTTCIGNSGPLPEPVKRAIDQGSLVAASVLSGNRNFEGRIGPDIRANFLASPPLVVAYALAGTVDIDLSTEPLGHGTAGDIYLKDIWPGPDEIAAFLDSALDPETFRAVYKGIEDANASWNEIPVDGGALYNWSEQSSYIQHPPFFTGMKPEPSPIVAIEDARVLVKVGDSVTTDHISPAGAIAEDGPAGLYLKSLGIAASDFNTFGSRRGNDRVMTRGTFGNIRLKNQLAPGTEGSWTTHHPSGDVISIYDAAHQYKEADTATIVLAGKDYGMGSSRDWAAKGTYLLGVKAVLATSFERIHRSNLVGMGVLPLQFKQGEDAKSLDLNGRETFAIGVDDELKPGADVTVEVTGEDGEIRSFTLKCRIDTPIEIDYYRNGGILHTVLRKIWASG